MLQMAGTSMTVRLGHSADNTMRYRYTAINAWQAGTGARNLFLDNVICIKTRRHTEFVLCVCPPDGYNDSRAITHTRLEQGDAPNCVLTNFVALLAEHGVPLTTESDEPAGPKS